MRNIRQKPEAIQRGGFQGGVHTGAANPTGEGSQLQQLAHALEGWTKQATGAAVQHKGQQVEEQLRQGHDRQQELIANRLHAYNAEELERWFGSDDAAQEFVDNPYVLPGLRVHQGRVQANELHSRMLQEVDPADSDAVDVWRRENLADPADPFASRGFNEQFERLESQRQQQAFQRNLTLAQSEHTNAASGELFALLEDNPEAPRGEVVSAWFQEMFETGQVDAIRAADIAVNVARQAAYAGDVELVEAIRTASRGNSIPLGQDARFMGEIAGYAEMAAGKARAADRDGHIHARTALFDMIEGGTTRAALEATEAFQTLPAEMQSQVIERSRAETQRLRREHDEQLSTRWQEQARQSVAGGAHEALRTGQAFLFDGWEGTNPVTGRTFRVSRDDALDLAQRELRRQMLGDSPLALTGEDAHQYRQYTTLLAANGRRDQQLEGVIASTVPFMTAEGLSQGGDDRVAQAYEIVRNIDPELVPQYVRDENARAVFAEIKNQLAARPDASVQDVLPSAVSIASAGGQSNRPFTAVANRIDYRLRDHSAAGAWWRPSAWSGEVRSALTTRGGQESGTVADIRARSPVTLSVGTPSQDVANAALVDYAEWEYRRYAGRFTEAEAVEMVNQNIQANWTVLDGRALRVPLDTTGVPEMAPRAWHGVARDYIAGMARAEDADPSEFFITHTHGNVYSIGRRDPEGGEPTHALVPAFQMQAAAEVFRRADAEEREEREREEGIRRARFNERERERRDGLAPDRVRELDPVQRPRDIPWEFLQ